MKRQRYTLKGLLLFALLLSGLTAGRAAAQDTQQQDSAKLPYTLAEYNAYQSANAETKPDARLKLLDDFVAKYPSSSLMQYVYGLYYPTYSQLKNYPKAMDYADKLIALADKAEPQRRLEAILARVQLFPFVFNAKAADAHDQLVKERDGALLGVKILQDLKRRKTPRRPTSNLPRAKGPRSLCSKALPVSRTSN
jgi:hypothetical protein